MPISGALRVAAGVCLEIVGSIPVLSIAVLVSAGIAALANASSYVQIDGTVVDPILCAVTETGRPGSCTAGQPHFYSGSLSPGATGSGDLSFADLTRADLAGSTITADLNLTVLTESDLRGASLLGNTNFLVDLTGASLQGAIFGNGVFGGAIFENANLSGATMLPGGNFSGGALFAGANLSNVLMAGIFFADANFSGANMTSANLSGGIFDQANFEGAILVGANLSGVTEIDTSTGSAFYSPTTEFTGSGFDPVAAGWVLVPEPSTASLFALGLVGLATRRRVLVRGSK